MARSKMIKVHPICIVLAIIVLLNGQLAIFTLYFTALIWHEIGHLFMMKLLKVPLHHCVIYPYGGEIVLQSPYAVRYRNRMLIAAGGPIFSLIGFLFASRVDSTLFVLFAEANLLLLLINSLPIWPLDGGRIVASIILRKDSGFSIYQFFLTISLVNLCIVLFVLLFFLPQSLFLLLNAIFIFMQLLNTWVNRKYSVILEKTLYKELT